MVFNSGGCSALKSLSGPDMQEACKSRLDAWRFAFRLVHLVDQFSLSACSAAVTMAFPPSLGTSRYHHWSCSSLTTFLQCIVNAKVFHAHSLYGSLAASDHHPQEREHSDWRRPCPCKLPLSFESRGGISKCRRCAPDRGRTLRSIWTSRLPWDCRYIHIEQDL